jgi:hypothetical protein
MDTFKPPPRPRSRWNTIFKVILAVLVTAAVSFAMWKSYLFAATALGSGFGWPRFGNGQLDVDLYDASPRLRFKGDGTFKISVLEDLHFGEGEDNRKCIACVLYIACIFELT